MITPENPSPATTSQTNGSTAPQSEPNFGTIVFAGFSLLSLVVCVAKGVVPIYLGEAALWAGLAWYWHKKSPANKTATATILLCAVGVAAAEGYSFGSRSRESVQPPPKQSLDEFISSLPATQAEPQPQPSCPSGISAGAKITEISPDQLEGAKGQAWYTNDDDEKPRGHWWFHFTVLNNNKDYCVTAVVYEVELESNDGVIITGHGKKYITPPLSPGFIYAPHQRDDDDELKLAVKPKLAAVNSWRITKGYGFPLVTRP
jgi:hypothetical protein